QYVSGVLENPGLFPGEKEPPSPIVTDPPKVPSPVIKPLVVAAMGALNSPRLRIVPELISDPAEKTPPLSISTNPAFVRVVSTSNVPPFWMLTVPELQTVDSPVDTSPPS